MFTAVSSPRVAGGLGLLLALATPATVAQAASWGSFDTSRMAYQTGTLYGTNHSELRGLIEDNGDELADATDELTPEYLAGVDIFYTAMLSDGTGPTAGALGTLSEDEATALAGFIADGGTLVIHPDSNGFEGPFEGVYDSWLSGWGVANFVYSLGFNTGSPVTAHPIMDGITAVQLDGTVNFTYPSEGEILAAGEGLEDVFIVVFEPSTGFAEGGRILVVSDHNAFTSTYINDLDNLALAQNIIEWADGECGNTILESGEECDDGNDDDDDGCSASCLNEGDGESTGDEGSGDGNDDEASGDGDGTTGAADGGTSDTMPGTTSGSPGTSSGAQTGSSGEATTEGDGGAADGGDGGGCGCSTGAPPWFGAALLLGLLGLRRRRR